jgi:hypothetical protein
MQLRYALGNAKRLLVLAGKRVETSFCGRVRPVRAVEVVADDLRIPISGIEAVEGVGTGLRLGRSRGDSAMA